MVHLSVIRILRLRSASEISIAGLVGFRFLLDSGLHVADAVTEAPLAAARDVDDAAFQHLLASPDEMSLNELPEYFTKSSAQTSALEVGSPFYVSPQAAGLYQPHYCAVPDDMYFYKCEDPAADSFPAQGCGDGLASYASALPSLSSQSDDERSESSSSEEDGDEDSVAPVCRLWQLSNPEYVASLLASRRTWNGMCWKNGGLAGGISKKKSTIVGSWAR